jgi:3-phenylpropionate/cinnamic acid dioxygenase small subunit
MLAADDILAIHQLIAEYSHVVDGRRWDDLPKIFTADGIFDAASAGYPLVQGLENLRRHMETATHPVAHYVTNIVVKPVDDNLVETAGMIIAPWPDGQTSTGGVYRDVIVRTPEGWRLKRRTVIAGKKR